MLELIDKEDAQPICPHCERDLTTVWQKKIRGVFGRRFVYFCPGCRKVLGVSHRKGFWMG